MTLPVCASEGEDAVKTVLDILRAGGPERSPHRTEGKLRHTEEVAGQGPVASSWHSYGFPQAPCVSCPGSLEAWS